MIRLDGIAHKVKKLVFNKSYTDIGKSIGLGIRNLPGALLGLFKSNKKKNTEDEQKKEGQNQNPENQNQTQLTQKTQQKNKKEKKEPKQTGLKGILNRTKNTIGNLFGKFKNNTSKKSSLATLVRVSTVDFVKKVGEINLLNKQKQQNIIIKPNQQKQLTTPINKLLHAPKDLLPINKSLPIPFNMPRRSFISNVDRIIRRPKLATRLLGRTKIGKMIRKPLGLLKSGTGKFGGIFKGVTSKIGNFFGRFKNNAQKKAARIPLVRISTVDYVKRVGIVDRIGGQSNTTKIFKGMSDKLSGMLDQNDNLMKYNKKIEKTRKLARFFRGKNKLNIGGNITSNISKKIKSNIGKKIVNQIGKQAVQKIATNAIGSAATGGATAAGGIGLSTALPVLAAAAIVAGVAGYGAYKSDDWHKQSGLAGKEEASAWSGAAASIDQVFQRGAAQRAKAFWKNGDISTLFGLNKDKYGTQWESQDFYMKQMGYTTEQVEAAREKRVEQKKLDDYKKNAVSGQRLSAIEQMDKQRQLQNKELFDNFNKRTKNENLRDTKGNKLPEFKNITDINRNVTRNLSIEQSYDFEQANAKQKSKQTQIIKERTTALTKDAGFEIKGAEGEYAHAVFQYIHEQAPKTPLDVYGALNQVKRFKNVKNKGRFLQPILNTLEQAKKSLTKDKGYNIIHEALDEKNKLKTFELDEEGTAVNGIQKYLTGQIDNIKNIINAQKELDKADNAMAELTAGRDINKAKKELTEESGSLPSVEQALAATKELTTSNNNSSITKTLNQSIKNAEQKVTVEEEKTVYHQKNGNVVQTTYNNKYVDASKNADVTFNNSAGTQPGIPNNINYA